MINTILARVKPDAIDEGKLAEAADLLRQGKLVVFPTETVYGIGANAFDADAVQRVFQAKGRPPENPVIVHIGNRSDVDSVVSEWPAAAQRLADKFWPGPLTLVLPKKAAIPPIVTAGSPTVAVRMPAHPVALRLIQLAGVPVAAPSANRSGELSPTTAEHALAAMNGRVDLIIDAGPTQVGLESTVLNLCSTPPQLLRPGMISPAQLEAEIGPIVRRESLASSLTSPVLSPGMLPRHYAPRTATECAATGKARVEELLRSGAAIGWVTFQADGWTSNALLHVRTMPKDPAEYGARLYATLHELDQLGLSRIVVDLPPQAEEWLAVRDRLMRASAQD
jgi:L-threonylcarbamoyladenylate synthase